MNNIIWVSQRKLNAHIRPLITAVISATFISVLSSNAWAKCSCSVGMVAATDHGVASVNIITCEGGSISSFGSSTFRSCSAARSQASGCLNSCVSPQNLSIKNLSLSVK